MIFIVYEGRKSVFMKKSNGITLIALVVTIVVLLILAAVSINMLIGENGIVTKARTAKDNYETAKSEEQANLDYVAGRMEDLTEGTGDSSSRNKSSNNCWNICRTNSRARTNKSS